MLLLETPPYPGAKPYFLIEGGIEDRDWVSGLARITAEDLPAPTPKKKRMPKKKGTRKKREDIRNKRDWPSLCEEPDRLALDMGRSAVSLVAGIRQGARRRSATVPPSLPRSPRGSPSTAPAGTGPCSIGTE
jgi:hypothetical protein